MATEPRPTGVLNAARNLARKPPLRAVLLHPPVRRTVAGLLSTRFLAAAWKTSTPLRYLTGEVLARGQVHSYRLRGDDRLVVVRHGIDGEAFYESFLGGEYEPPAALIPRIGVPTRVLDVGAKIGMFSAWAARRWPTASVHAYEPEPTNLAQLRHWLELCRVDATKGIAPAPAVTVHPAAVTTTVGTAPLATGGAGAPEASGAGAPEASGAEPALEVPTVDFFAELAGSPAADLVKIDIDGGEWALLADPRLAEIERLVIVLAYHPDGAPSLPAFTAASRLLEAADFEVGYPVPNVWGHGTLWAWKG